jgi:DNA-binding NtrC family response regulator
MGGGVGFERMMVSRNPGNIILLLEAGTGLNAANDRFNLSASLSLAGHEVFIAKNTDELLARSNAAAPDLILVDASRAEQSEIQPVSGGAGPVIMPIAYLADGSLVAASYQPASCVTIADGRKGTQILKAVEHALKLRSRGLPPCGTSTDSQKT